MEKAKLGITRFFTGYFKYFPKLILANLLFAVPLVGFCALFYFVNTASGLNNIFITLLPIIFVFPFFAGITVITRNIVREDKKIAAVSLFFKGLRDNLKYFIVHGIVLYLAIFFCYSSISLYWQLAGDNGVFYIAFGLVVVIAIFMLFVFYNLPAMTVTFELSLGDIYRNSALMSFGELKNNFFATLGLFLLFIFCATVFLAAPNATVLVWIMLIVSVLIVPSTASYIMNFYVYKDMEAVISNGQAKTDEIQQKIKSQKNKRDGIEEKEKLDFSGLDLDETKDPDEYLYFNGKMIKRGVLIKMRDEQE